MKILETERTVLREWRPEDIDALAQINADPRVLEFIPGPITREQTQAFIERCIAHQHEHGFGLWAVELKQTGALIGFGGLNIPQDNLPFSPCVEIGARGAHEHWGRWYPIEIGKAVLKAAFTTYGLDEVVAFTNINNLRSRICMERLGFTRDLAGDFLHPRLPAEHPLALHVLYRIDNPQTAAFKHPLQAPRKQ
ncbi:MAG TPA: GNAT family N-acetyltransferase [Opitutales bacterium]|nr:GNAT family N-acetyltransferase [Opitutales bacterium]